MKTVNLSQPSLFGTNQDLPEGFFYIPNFISESEEKSIIQKIGNIEFGHLTIQGVPSKRKIKHFGVGYSFETKQLTAAVAIPDWILPLQKRVAKFTNLEPAAFAEILITEYEPGAGISWHRDAPPFGMIAGISLNTSSRFKLRLISNFKQVREINVAARSLYILSAKARSEWQHSVPPVKTLRYSITFRTLR